MAVIGQNFYAIHCSGKSHLFISIHTILGLFMAGIRISNEKIRRDVTIEASLNYPRLTHITKSISLNTHFARKSSVFLSESGQDVFLGLSVPAEIAYTENSIEIVGLPNLGKITLSDGTAVFVGQRISAEELEELRYCGPGAAYDGAADVGNFTYGVNFGVHTETGIVDIQVATCI